MKVGEKIVAVFSIGFPDYVSEGEVYEIVEIQGDGIGFRIINDKGELCFPLEAMFTPYRD